MTVSSDVNRSGPYTGNGVTTVFNYGFRILDKSHLRVIRREVSGETELAVDTDYTVADVGTASGGQITMSVAPTDSQTITIIRDVPFVQETDLENQGPYFAETVEQAFDLGAMRDQQLSERLDRAVTVPISEGADALNDLVENILRLSDSADAIDAVAGVVADVSVVAGIAGDVAAVADIDFPTLHNDVDAIRERYLGEFADDAAATSAASGTPTAGALYWNTGSASFRIYTGGAWTETVGANSYSADTFIGDGTANPLTLSGTPGGINSIQVYIEGESPQPPTIFSLVGDQLSPPSGAVWPNGRSIVVLYGSSVEIGTPGNGTVGKDQLSANAIADKTHDATEKASLADDDEFGGADSAASYAFKRWKWSTIKSAIQTIVGSFTTPTGAFGFFDRSTAPSGWVKANGGTIGSASSGGTARANADTEALFTLIWDQFDDTVRPIQDSAGSASTRGASAAADFAANKRLPLANPRGKFLRALDDGAGVDTGRALGSAQADAFQGHYHNTTGKAGSGGNYGWSGVAGASDQQAGTATTIITNGSNGTPRIASETRPTNYAALCCIKL